MKTRIVVALLVVLAGALAYGFTQLPMIAAGGLLYPARRATTLAVPDGCVDAEFSGVGVTLHGWRCAAKTTRRGTVVYLHGVADNRASAAGALKHFMERGFDAIAYDSRAHGDSTGEICTYGYFEKQDLSRVLDTITEPGIILMGHSLGAAVALQAAAEDQRIDGAVVVESFSDLRTIARERAWFLPQPSVDAAFRYAEERGGFAADAVSPVAAASRIHVPVLVIHGKEDDATAPRHSERIFEALGGPKRLLLVDRARHNQSMAQPAVWIAVDRWIEQIADSVAAREFDRQLAQHPSEPAPEWINGRPPETLAGKLAELRIAAPSELAGDLEQYVTFSPLVQQEATWIAYQIVQAKSGALPELTLGRFDPATQTWRIHRAEFDGRLERVSTLGNFIIATGRINPSTALLMVVDDDALRSPAVLFGFAPLMVPGGLVYKRGMVHFAPTHSARVGWFNGETGEDDDLYPQKPYGPVRQAFIERTRTVYARARTSGECAKLNHHCDPEYFEASVSRLTYDPQRREVVFVTSFGEGFEGDPIDAPAGRETVLVACGPFGSGSPPPCRERRLSEIVQGRATDVELEVRRQFEKLY